MIIILRTIDYHPSHIMDIMEDGEVNWSNEFLELVERRYMLILCLNRRVEDWGVEFAAEFFKGFLSETYIW